MSDLEKIGLKKNGNDKERIVIQGDPVKIIFLNCATIWNEISFTWITLLLLDNGGRRGDNAYSGEGDFFRKTFSEFGLGQFPKDFFRK